MSEIERISSVRHQSVRASDMSLPNARKMMRHKKQRWFLHLFVVSVAACCISQFQVYHEVVLNNLYEPIEHWLRNVGYTKDQVFNIFIPLLAASTNIGGIIGGSLLVAPIVDRSGRRITNIGLAALSSVSGILLLVGLWARSFVVIIVARVLTGVASGMAMLSVNLLLVETAPKHLRGAFTAMTAVFFSLGDLAGVWVSSPFLLGTDSLWGLALIVGYVPAFLAFPVMLWSKESPRYLYLFNNDYAAAENALYFYQGPVEAEATLSELNTERETQAMGLDETPIMSFGGLWKNASYWSATKLSVLLYLACHAVGIHIIMQFSTPILQIVGLDHNSAAMGTTAMVTIKFLFSFLAMPAMECCGRKTSLLFGLFTCASCFLAAGLTDWLVPEPHSHMIGWIICGIFILSMCLYNILSASVYTLSVEIFPQRARAKGLSVGTTVDSITAAASSFLFPFLMLHRNLQLGYISIGCTVLSFLLFIYFVKRVPETAGRSFQDAQDDMNERLIENDKDRDSLM